MRMMNESKNRGFGGWEAITITLLPVIFCGGIYLLLERAIQEDDPIAMLMVLGGVIVLAAFGIGGCTLAYEAVKRRGDSQTVDNLKEQGRAAEVLARSLAGIAATSQTVSHGLQKQLGEANKQNGAVLPYPDAPPIIYDGEAEDIG